MVFPPVPPLANMPVVIHALLKPRWTWLPQQHRFATATREVPLAESLRGAEVAYLVDRLQKLAASDLSAPEKKLARWVQIKLPPQADADTALQAMVSLPCVAEAHVMPPPSPPGAMQAPTG